MSNPSPALDRFPVFGAYQGPDGKPETGKITFAVPQRLARTDGRQGRRGLGAECA